MDIKEILVLHHSHLDVGYTHSQPILWEMQREYLDLALDFLEATADYPAASRPRWTCEVTSPVVRWLETADAAKVARFGAYLTAGRIGISGFEYNTTPLCSAEQLARQFYPAQYLRDRFGVTINTVHQHDVNGVPWTMAELMIEAGIELFIMAINLHFGGAAADRPGVFRWQAPSGRELLVMNGNHYTMFDQLLYTWEHSIERMREGLTAYLEVLRKGGYAHDFLYLTAANPPQMWDNSPPNIRVAELILEWNRTGMSPPIRFVTPQMLLDRIRQIPASSLPVHRGDWTDYWNFGSASTAAETRRNQHTKSALFAAELLRAYRGEAPAPVYTPDKHVIQNVADRAWQALNLYDEHTWGAAASIRWPDLPHVKAQRQLKLSQAYEAHELARYLLVTELEALAANPPQAEAQAGLLLVNPTPLTQAQVISIPASWSEPGKRLRTNRFTQWDEIPQADDLHFAPVTLPPFSWRKIPLDDLAEVAPKATVARGPAGDGRFIENEHYRLEYDPTIGRIIRLYDKQRGWEVLPAGSSYTFFEFIHEQPDPRLDNRRTALYKRDLEREKFGLSCWQTDWVAQRRGIEQFLGYDEVEEPHRITLGLKFTAPGVDWLEQRLTLHGESPLIELEVQMMKRDIRTPEATYLVFPLNMAAGWDCHFDSAGMPLTLDREQLPGASRDWVTVESFVSVHRGGLGMTLFCPDAPMVQVGDFNFGRKQDEIPRQANPLLLAWPLNNYWDTNFAASQPGLIRLRYAFTTHDAFDPLEAIQQGQAVRTDVLVHPLIHCAKAESGTFFELEGEGTHVLHVKPATSGKGVIMRLVNMTTEETRVRLQWTERPIREAYLTTPMEVDQDSLPVIDGTAQLRMPPRQIMSVRLVPG